MPIIVDGGDGTSLLEVSDLPASIQSNELVLTLVAGANAKAARVAPCLVSTDPAPTEEQVAEAKLILVGAVKRWAEAGSGALQQQSAGPFSMATDTRQRTGFNLWPSEIAALQDICASAAAATAFSVDTMPAGAGPGYWSEPDVWTTLP